VSLTSGALAGGISRYSVQAAPPALAKWVAAGAVAKGATASASTMTLIKGALRLMAWTKAKIAVAVASALVLTTGVTVAVVQSNNPMRGKTESEWIKSIVYRGDENQTKLWRSFGSRGIRMLVRALKSSEYDRATRMCVACLIDQLGDDAKSAIPDLIVQLKTEKEEDVRALELAYFGIPIQRMPPDEKMALFPELLDAMQSRDASVRNNALVEFQNYPQQAEAVIPLIVQSLQDASPMVRLMAVKAMLQVDPQNPAKSNFVPIVVGCLTGPSGNTPGVPNDAVLMLGKLHQEPDLAVPALIQSLASADSYVRQNSAWSLGEFGTQARSAIPALQKALADSDANVRRSAASALKRIESGV
jgi:hypothetical protein